MQYLGNETYLVETYIGQKPLSVEITKDQLVDIIDQFLEIDQPLNTFVNSLSDAIEKRYIIETDNKQEKLEKEVNDLYLEIDKLEEKVEELESSESFCKSKYEDILDELDQANDKIRQLEDIERNELYKELKTKYEEVEAGYDEYKNIVAYLKGLLDDNNIKIQ